MDFSNGIGRQGVQRGEPSQIPRPPSPPSSDQIMPIVERILNPESASVSEGDVERLNQYLAMRTQDHTDSLTEFDNRVSFAANTVLQSAAQRQTTFPCRRELQQNAETLEIKLKDREFSEMLMQQVDLNALENQFFEIQGKSSPKEAGKALLQQINMAKQATRAIQAEVEDFLGFMALREISVMSLEAYEEQKLFVSSQLDELKRAILTQILAHPFNEAETNQFRENEGLSRSACGSNALCATLLELNGYDEETLCTKAIELGFIRHSHASAEAEGAGLVDNLSIESVGHAFEDIFKVDEEKAIRHFISKDNPVEGYLNLLTDLKSLSQKPNIQIGAILRKAAEFYSVVYRRLEDGSDRFIFIDSHGSPLVTENSNAFRAEFDDIESAAEFLALRAPFLHTENMWEEEALNTPELHPLQLVWPAQNREEHYENFLNQGEEKASSSSVSGKEFHPVEVESGQQHELSRQDQELIYNTFKIFSLNTSPENLRKVTDMLSLMSIFLLATEQNWPAEDLQDCLRNANNLLPLSRQVKDFNIGNLYNNLLWTLREFSAPISGSGSGLFGEGSSSETVSLQPIYESLISPYLDKATSLAFSSARIEQILQISSQAIE